MRAVALAVAMCCVICTAEAQRGISFEAYAGHLPSDRIGGRSFIDAIRPMLQPAIGDARWRRLAGYGTAAPITAASDREFGRVLIAWQCRPHDCGNEATVVVTAGGQLVAVCFADGERAEWFGPGWRAPGREAECGWEPAEVFARLRAARARQ